MQYRDDISLHELLWFVLYQKRGYQDFLYFFKIVSKVPEKNIYGDGFMKKFKLHSMSTSEQVYYLFNGLFVSCCNILTN